MRCKVTSPVFYILMTVLVLLKTTYPQELSEDINNDMKIGLEEAMRSTSSTANQRAARNVS